MKEIATLGLLALVGCTTARDVTPALMGNWGGEHIELIVGSLDSAVVLDCAEGTIFGGYSVDRRGNFEWVGDFTRGTGGPERVGHVPPSVPATYSGVLRGPEMTLSIALADGQSLGPFKLTRFEEARLTRCL